MNEIICGLKLTHDSAIALIDKGKLMFSIELEKLDNNNRYKILPDISLIPEILSDNGYSLQAVDRFVIDGWVGLESASVPASYQGKEMKLEVAPYHEKDFEFDGLSRKYSFGHFPILNNGSRYDSYTHVAGHLFSAYCTSPFAAAQEPSYVLIWDGGMHPRLYFFDPAKSSIQNLGALFHLSANVYSIFAQHFGPFKINENVIKDELSIAGKVMAYIALGQARPEILRELRTVYEANLSCAKTVDMIQQFPYVFSKKFKAQVQKRGHTDEDILTSFHHFIEALLLDSLEAKLKERPLGTSNLCFAGGAALNIKWNSALRNSNLFKETWVCPFPNDSGSAIGAACCARYQLTGNPFVDWSVSSGPQLKPVVDIPGGWTSRPCSVNELAGVIYEKSEPVVFLNGNAELGPRALGNRSILASPCDRKMKSILNVIKYRESYRPVAPICMEEKAPLIFDPGCRDPYMLYDHKINNEWLDKIPAVAHLDGTARLQTVNARENPEIYLLLTEFERLSGIPLLCNTSANFKGSGFFPDVESAARWGKVNYIWSNNTLYEKSVKTDFTAVF